MDRSKTTFSLEGKREQGAAIVETIIALPVLLVVILGAIQFGLIYQAKATLNHAGLQAARAGAVGHADSDAMRKGLARGLLPLYSPGASLADAARTLARVREDVTSDARIRIVNPTREAFDDFGESTNGIREIPNDRLYVRSTAIGPRSGLNIQDANLLRIHVTYGYELKVPLINGFLSRLLLASGSYDDFERQLLRRGRLPITTTSTVRMQSTARESELVVARAALPDVARVPAQGELPVSPGSSGQASGDEGRSGETDPTSGGGTHSLADPFFGFGSAPADGARSEEDGGAASGEDEPAPPDQGSNEGSGGAADEAPLCTPTDSAEAEDEEQGTLARIWNELRNLAGQAYDFVSGFWDGIKNQIADFVDLVTDPIETARGMYELARAFLEDPAATVAEIGRALGRDIGQLVQCGAYDRGRVLGNYVSPAFMVKLAGKLARFGNLRRSLDETVREFEREMGTANGCASFGAGTLVLAGESLVPIERITRGTTVSSRGADYLDRNRIVERTFRREAPRYRYVETEQDEFHVTEEHPFWVQGRGWVSIREIELGAPVATLRGDTLILANAPVEQQTTVFNFSVQDTASYFVGREGVWVHNAFCEADAALKYSNVFGTRLPRQGSGGSWSGQRGNSEWQPYPDTPLHQATGGRAIVFRDGYPDFEPFAYRVDGAPVQFNDLQLNGTNADLVAANRRYRELYGQSPPENYTWHHHQDCRTLILVPSVINNPDVGGVPHSGGASRLRNGTC
jgi:hypothetical protein